ncbi:MAG: pilus assembly protein PilB [Planctomycetota bacterium]|nr:MAG: pilus assembly protein PilB [Planctomycetota bacterium]
MAKRLGDILVDTNTITTDQLKEALDLQKKEGKALGEALISLGYVTNDTIEFALKEQSEAEKINLDEFDITPDLISLVPREFAEMSLVFPLKMENDVLTIAMANPSQISTLDSLRFMINKDVKALQADQESIEIAINRFYGKGQSIQSLIQEMSLGDDASDVEQINKNDIEDQAADPNALPVIKLVNIILLQAIKEKGSDIHFEPFENVFRVRYRIDGVLYEMDSPPKHLGQDLTARVKVMANLKIDENRLPQDGRIELSLGGEHIDLRISTLPTMFGESTVMRILDKSQVNLSLDSVGLNQDEVIKVREYIKKPHGIVLVTGPTGSGKTTTLYSALSEANDVKKKIITCEDPVEYEMEGIIQVAINEKVGLTFPIALRSILRQDPDTLLIGEIRDNETANIAIESALTGHLVFSTLHTNDAPSAVTRLIDQDVPAFLVAAVLEAVVAQRLVKTICNNCRTPYEPSEGELISLDIDLDEASKNTFYYGKGCDMCRNGYKGRTAIFEFLDITPAIKELIANKSSTEQIMELAIQEGMKTLRQSGIEKVFSGLTTIEEIQKYTIES